MLKKTVLFYQDSNSNIIEQTLSDVNGNGFLKVDPDTGEELKCVGGVYISYDGYLYEGDEICSFDPDDIVLEYAEPGEPEVGVPYPIPSYDPLPGLIDNDYVNEMLKSKRLVITCIIDKTRANKKFLSDPLFRKLTRDEIKSELKDLMKDLEEFIPDSLDEFKQRVEIGDINSYEREKWDRITEYRWLLGDSDI